MFGFREVWCVDTEFGTAPDGRPLPRCLVAVEYYSRREIRLWETDLSSLQQPPFNIGPEALFVAYAVPAELGVFVELGWPMPCNVIDLWVEYLAVRNGYRAKNEKTRLIDALAHYGLMSMAVEEKEEMRALAIRGGPYTDEEKAALLEYCAGDVRALLALLPAMEPDLREFHPDEMRLRGRRMIATTRVTGVPLDVPALREIVENREAVCLSVAQAGEADHGWGIYAGARFTMDGYIAWLNREGIRVPPTKKTGQPTTKSEVLKSLCGRYPQLGPLYECTRTLDALSDFRLSADSDGRSRPFTNPFGSVTGRNQPSSTGFIFSLPKWFRHLIKPPEGWGVAYLDARAQEVLIGAVLSGCRNMLRDYFSGDVHLGLAIRLGMAPAGATKQSHRDARARGKTILFGNNYGQTEYGLDRQLGCGVATAREYLKQYREAYPEYFSFRQSNVNGLSRRERRYFTKLGWPYWPGQPGKSRKARARTMMNFPVQAHGSDWLHIVLIAATEAGIQVCATVHDGLLIAAPLGRLDEDIERMSTIMQAASVRLFGLPMFIDCDPETAIVRWPDRFVPEEVSAQKMWSRVRHELRRIAGSSVREAA